MTTTYLALEEIRRWYATRAAFQAAIGMGCTLAGSPGATMLCARDWEIFDERARLALQAQCHPAQPVRCSND